MLVDSARILLFPGFASSKSVLSLGVDRIVHDQDVGVFNTLRFPMRALENLVHALLLLLKPSEFLLRWSVSAPFLQKIDHFMPSSNAEGAQGTICRDTLTERRETATGTEAAPNDKSHIKLQSTNNLKLALGKAMLSKKNSEVLSPLVLSPYEDIDFVGCPFILEEPLHKEQQHSFIRTEAKTSKKHSIGAKLNLQRSYAGRSSSSLTGLVKDWKPQNQLVSYSSTSKRTSQGSYLGAWEFSSSNEIDSHHFSRNVHSFPSSSLERQHQYDITAGSVKNSRSSASLLNSNGLQSALPLTRMSYVTKDAISSTRESVKASCVLDCEVVNPLKEAGAVAESSLADRHSLTSGMELTVVTEQPSRSLSQKYRPRVFEELVGQELVVQALSSAIAKGKIAPVYLFHGSRGTGKTSAARILATALNCCTLHVDTRPCTYCPSCKTLALGKSSGVREVDAASHRGIDDVYVLVQRMLATPSHSRYKVFIIDECHMLTDETWNALLNFLEEPPGDFVFILVTTDLDSLPCTASSRCQKFFFMKVKHSDIVKRLNKLVALEGLDVEHEALDIIASRSDGSLRDAEMMLDQLSLFGQTIASSAVLDLVGPVSDERILNLLDLALGSDTIRTVKKAKELVDSGVEPLELMTRLARLITDILAGSQNAGTGNSNVFVSRHMGSKEGLQRLSAALRTLLEAEKQLKVVHHDRMAWLTAALLQLGRFQQPRFLLSSSTSATTSPVLQKVSGNLKGRHITKWTNTRSILNKMSPHSDHGNWATTFKPKARLGKANLEARIHPTLHPFPEDITRAGSVDSSEAGSSPFSSKGSERRTSFFGPGNLGNLWLNILKGCKSLPLRHLLSHGKLLAVCFTTVEAMVHLEFKDPEQKFRAERYRKVIANTCKKGLGLSVNVKISLASQPLREELLASPLPLLAERTQADEVRSEECVDALRLEDEVSAKLKQSEGGSLQHWRDQSGQNIIKPDYPAYNMPSYHASFSAQTQGTIHPFRGDLEFSISEAVMPQERHEVTWAGRIDESTAGYWQLSPGLREHKKTLRYSESVETHAASTFDSTDGQHAQRPPHGSALSSYYEDQSSSRLDTHEQESLGLEAQPKYRKLLCWKVPIEEAKPLKRPRRRRCRAFNTFIPCGKTTS